MQNIRLEIPNCCPCSLGEILNHVKSPNKRPAMVEVVTMLKALTLKGQMDDTFLRTTGLFIPYRPVWIEGGGRGSKRSRVELVKN